MKRFAAKWKRRKSGDMVMKWKERKVKGLYYCPLHGGQEVNKQGICVRCDIENILP